MAQLSEAIGLMRKDIRKSEKDVRQNARAMKILLAFLRTLKVSDLKADPNAPKASILKDPGESTSTRKKRKRAKQDDSPGEPDTLKTVQNDSHTPRALDPPPAPALRKTAATSLVSSSLASSSSQPALSSSAPPAHPSPSTPYNTFPQQSTALSPPLPQNDLGDSLVARMIPGNIPSPVPPGSSDFQANGAYNLIQVVHQPPAVSPEAAWGRR